MKKILFLSTLLAAVLLATSCQKEQELVTLGAVINQPTKTYINDRYPCWNEGDQVYVNTDAYPVSAISGSSAQIADVVGADAYRAIYPATLVTPGSNIATSATIPVTLPATQKYQVVDGHQRVDAPMGAYTDGSTLLFHNLCSIMHVVVNNNTGSDMTLGSLKMESTNAMLSGTGTATVNGSSILGLNQQKIRTLGVSLVPEDRMLYGIAAGASIEENMISDRCADKRYNHGPLFNMKAIHDETDRLIEEYTVLCKNRGQQVGMLSGGNIQKVVVAREFSNNPSLILADQPTRGIDVGATEFIRKKLVELSRSGIAVLLVSADLNEVMELSDSLIVMHNGRIAAYFDDTAGLTDDIMGEYMLGLRKQSPAEIRRACHD